MQVYHVHSLSTQCRIATYYAAYRLINMCIVLVDYAGLLRTISILKVVKILVGGPAVLCPGLIVDEAVRCTPASGVCHRSTAADRGRQTEVLAQSSCGPYTIGTSCSHSSIGLFALGFCKGIQNHIT